MSTLGYRYTDEQRRRMSEGRRKAWAEVKRGPGLAAMRAACASDTECPFCGDEKRPGAKSCGEPECDTAYMRCYRRDRRAALREAKRE